MNQKVHLLFWKLLRLCGSAKHTQRDISYTTGQAHKTTAGGTPFDVARFSRENGQPCRATVSHRARKA